MEFKEFIISEEIQKAVEELGFTEATEIQAQSIPLLLEGRDIIGFSQTGSGKTAAFGIPAIEFIDFDQNPRHPQVLILCPTRELSLQACEELSKFAKYKRGLHVVPIYGGEQIDRQLVKLRKGCQIVVGTPGRIMDHMRRRTLKFDSLRTVILDEADEMLNMGFREDIETILSETPESRQTVLFSATMPREIIEITGKYQQNPEMVKIQNKQMTVSTIEQSYFEVARGRKQDALSLLLQYYQPKLSVIFCNTKKMVDEIVSDLKSKGYSAEGLHGDIKQQQRSYVMNLFKNGGFNILVATDVAARGIDVNDIDIVFNFDLPMEKEYYVHRIGRTGRAGKDGRSFTLVQGGRQLRELQDIARYTKSTITKKRLPLVAEIQSKNTHLFVEQVKSFAAENDCSSSKKELEQLNADGLSTEEVACALLKMLLDERTLKEGTVDVPIEKLERSYEGAGSRQHNRVRVPNARAARKFEGVDMASIQISIGRNDRVAPNHILGAVAGESGLPGKLMGTIDIHRDHTTVDVPKEFRERIIKALNNKTVMGKKVTVK